jgi:hypothetical protein
MLLTVLHLFLFGMRGEVESTRRFKVLTRIYQGNLCVSLTVRENIQLK